MIDILYFAWVRERIGTGAETLSPPSQIATGHAAALADRAAIRVAIDQDFVAMDAAIAGGREIAIFPPVTGG